MRVVDLDIALSRVMVLRKLSICNSLLLRVRVVRKLLICISLLPRVWIMRVVSLDTSIA